MVVRTGVASVLVIVGEMCLIALDVFVAWPTMHDAFAGCAGDRSTNRAHRGTDGATGEATNDTTRDRASGGRAPRGGVLLVILGFVCAFSRRLRVHVILPGLSSLGVCSGRAKSRSVPAVTTAALATALDVRPPEASVLAIAQ